MNDPKLEDLFHRFARTGDSQALAAVFDRTAADLLLVAAHLGDAPDVAEDALQATFLRAIEIRERFDPSRPLLPWLIGILSNEVRSGRRRARRQVDPERLEGRVGATQEVSALDASAAREQVEFLTHAVGELPGHFRDVLNLRVVHGLSPTEIAHALNRSLATVKSQLSRGREALKRALPAGIAAPSAIFLLSGRGVAAVRGEVLRAAGGVGAAVTGGGVASSGWLLRWAAALLLLAGLGYVGWNVWGGEGYAELTFVPLVAGTETVAAPAAGVAPKVPLRRALESRGASAGKRVAGLDGRVLDEAGRPLAAVQVELRRSYQDSNPLRTRTDRQGRFAFAVELPGDQTQLMSELIFSSSGRERRQLSAVAKLGSETRVEDVVLRPGGALAGIVHDVEGKPVEGVEVTLAELGPVSRRSRYSVTSTSLGTAVTDAHGAFRFSGVRVGGVRVWAQPDGFRRYFYSAPIDVRPAHFADGLVVEVGADDWSYAVGFTVVGPGGEVLPDALPVRARLKVWHPRYPSRPMVSIVGGSGKSWCESYHNLADRIPDPDGAMVEISAMALNGEYEPGAAVTVPLGERQARVPLGRRRPSVPLRVVDGDGESIRQFSVCTLPATGHDKIGEFKVRAPRPGTGAHAPKVHFPVDLPWRLRVTSEGFVTRTLGPFGRLADPLVVELEHLASIRGVVRDAGGPVAGATVTLGYRATGVMVCRINGYFTRYLVTSSSATTDARGRFELALVDREGPDSKVSDAAPGWVVSARATGRGAAEVDVSGGVRDGVRLQLPGAGSLQGQVFDAEGRPAAGRIVGMTRGDPFPLTQRCDEAGRFAFDDAGAGPWEVRLVERELDPASRSWGMGRQPNAPPWAWNTVVRSGAETWIELSDRKRLRLRGAVRFGGVGIAGATVHVDSAGGGVATDGRGNYALAVDEAGTCTLRLRHAVTESCRVNVETDVRIARDITTFDLDLPVGTVRGALPKLEPRRGVQGLRYEWQGRVDGRAVKAWIEFHAVDDRYELPCVPAGRGRVVRWWLPPGRSTLLAPEQETLFTVDVAASR